MPHDPGFFQREHAPFLALPGEIALHAARWTVSPTEEFLGNPPGDHLAKHRQNGPSRLLSAPPAIARTVFARHSNHDLLQELADSRAGQCICRCVADPTIHVNPQRTRILEVRAKFLHLHVFGQEPL